MSGTQNGYLLCTSIYDYCTTLTVRNPNTGPYIGAIRCLEFSIPFTVRGEDCWVRVTPPNPFRHAHCGHRVLVYRLRVVALAVRIAIF